MKTSTKHFILYGLLSLSPCLFGQSPFERDLAKLKSQKQKAVAAAIAPIEFRYQEEIEKLLRKATQAGDLQAALKIRSELGKPVGLPDAAIEFNGKWYCIYPDQITWIEARKKCKALGGELASVTDETTHNFIKNLAPNVQLWLGATDEKSEGAWKWENGFPMQFSAWIKGEPSGGTQENCIYVVDSGWKDANNGELHGFICEWSFP